MVFNLVINNIEMRFWVFLKKKRNVSIKYYYYYYLCEERHWETKGQTLQPRPQGVFPWLYMRWAPPLKSGKRAMGTRLQTLTSKWPWMFNDVSENHFKPGINSQMILPYPHYCIHIQMSILFLERTFYLRGLVRG